MASNYAGNNSRSYPNAFLNNYVKWNSDVLSSQCHTQIPNGSKYLGIHDKSTKREIRVLVTSIEHLSTSYDNTHYLCNKLHV